MKRWPIACLLALSLIGCNEAPLKPAPADAGPPVAGLTPEQASRVVAKAGDRTITLGDFARALERMDQFDRLRYQSKERRRELLDEMIDVQLLAAEARRQGLDKDPETADAVRMILRDAILAESRQGLPAPAQIPDQEVRAYFEAHPERFSEPERRRVAAIVLPDKDRKEAEKILKAAIEAKNVAAWGELFFKHSLTAPKQHGPANPAELAGDLGIVGPPDDARGANPKVPEAVRAAVFKLKDLNEVDKDLVEADGRFYIVRMNGRTMAHKRTLPEADRSIRVLLVQEKMVERERALEDELRKKYPVQIDDAALASVRVPSVADKVEMPQITPAAATAKPAETAAPTAKPAEKAKPGGKPAAPPPHGK